MNNGRYNSEDKGDEAGQDIPAVAYVRMSTDHQKYSTENQLDIIRDYATARGLQILRVFEDSGRSGLRLDGREALQNLMAEVRTGQADFKAILVYDVSRWGRFQDADEGTYHEHVCSRAGIRVHYCGEQFENDGSIDSNLLKTVKYEQSNSSSLRIQFQFDTFDRPLIYYLDTFQLYYLQVFERRKPFNIKDTARVHI